MNQRQLLTNQKRQVHSGYKQNIYKGIPTACKTAAGAN